MPHLPGKRILGSSVDPSFAEARGLALQVTDRSTAQQQAGSKQWHVAVVMIRCIGVGTQLLRLYDTHPIDSYIPQVFAIFCAAGSRGRQCSLLPAVSVFLAASTSYVAFCTATCLVCCPVCVHSSGTFCFSYPVRLELQFVAYDL